jgi:hypothetical protein
VVQSRRDDLRGERLEGILGETGIELGDLAIEVRDEVKDPLLRTVLRFEIERLR